MTSVEEQTSGSDLVVRDSGAALVRPIPIPRELQELGIKIGADPESGIRVVYLPDELRRVCNVVNPTSSYVQADPNWTPGISIVKLDVQRDTYNVAGKRGLGKQALETIAKAAGVLYTRTARVPRNELQPNEDYAYRATVGFRRSDGTIDEVTRERGFIREVEQAEIEDAVRGGDKTKDLPEDRKVAEIRKRWLAELRFGPSKTESKAINRALRAGLAIPTSLSPADAAKPFLIIGYNFTPDYSDPEIKRALVAVGLNAQAAIYGGRAVSDEVPELAAGDIPAGALVVEGSAGPPADDEGAAAVSPPAAPLSEQGGDGSHSRTPVTASSPDPDGEPEPTLEPELEPTPAAPLQVPEAAIDAAAATVIASKQKTIAEILSLEGAPVWVAWALRNLEDDDERAALALVVQHRVPELWAVHAGQES